MKGNHHRPTNDRIERPPTGPRPGRRETTDDTRGQSSLIGTLLILSLVVTAAAIILVLGGVNIDDVQTQSETESAEHAMANLDAKASLVALGTNKRSVVVPLETGSHGKLSTNDTGNIKITVTYQNTGTTEVLLDQQLGEVTYENKRSGEVIAYQGGGVWRGTGNQSRMVSPPEFHYRGETLTVPLVVVDDVNSSPGGNRLLVERNGERPVYPNATAGYANPLNDGRVEITMTSDYYVAWGSFFEERTGGEVSYDHPNDQVTITLVTPLNPRPVDNAFAATTPGNLKIIANGGDDFTDSYNSSVDPYSVANSEQGDVTSRGSIELQGNADLNGNVTAETSVLLKSNPSIDGYIEHGSGCSTNTGGTTCDDLASGYVANNGTVPQVDDIDSVIENRVQTLSDPGNNDNGVTGAIDSNSFDGTSVTLDAGEYYVDDTSGIDQLELDTSGGNIILGIDDDIDWTNVDVDVTDPSGGRVLMYVNGSQVSLSGVNMGDRTTDNSTALRLYGKSGLDLDIVSNTKFVGLVYAPSADATEGEVLIQGSKTEVFGAIVAGGTETKVQAGADLHYDKALANTPAITRGNAIPRVTYVHMTVNKLVFEGQ